MRAVGVTGVTGLLGWHLRCHLRARSTATVVPADREIFEDRGATDRFVGRCDTIVHLAGPSRGNEAEVERAHPLLASALVESFERTGAQPHVIFANSVHASGNTPYGRSKRAAAEILGEWAGRRGGSFTDLILPHVFGECARPFHNSVVATLCHQLAHDQSPSLREDAELELVHAQRVAAAVVDGIDGIDGGPPVRGRHQVRLRGRRTTVAEVLDELTAMADRYRAGIIPDLRRREDVELFNTYRSYLFPQRYPAPFEAHRDDRGVLIEVVKGGGGGQTYVSYSRPEVTRGDHFHLRKVERFAILRGDAVVRVRRLFDDQVHEMRLSDDRPAFVDIPTLHTHNVTNVGRTELVMAFWANDIYDPARPDTVAEQVVPCP